MLQYLGTLWIALTSVSGVHEPRQTEQRIFCTFLLLGQGDKAELDWLRLFDNTSFYVTLISKAISDIVYIGLIIFINLVYIGRAMYMLQLHAPYYSAPAGAVSSPSGDFIVDHLSGH